MEANPNEKEEIQEVAIHRELIMNEALSKVEKFTEISFNSEFWQHRESHKQIRDIFIENQLKQKIQKPRSSSFSIPTINIEKIDSLNINSGTAKNVIEERGEEEEEDEETQKHKQQKNL